MFDVKGRWALVTGGSRGIGKLAAIALAQQGSNIIIQCREVSHAQATIDAVSALGVEVKAVAAELSDAGSVKKMLDEIDNMGVRVDIVLNNAGMQIAYRKDYYETPVSDYDISFKINTIAPMMICYHFLPKMVENGVGRIVNTTSGIRLEPEQAGYSASKAALDKVTVDIASKLNGSDVIISLTDPGWCRTDLGGPNAPNAPEDAIPGVVVGAFVDDGKSGRLFAAGDFIGLSLEDAVNKAETYTAPF